MDVVHLGQAVKVRVLQIDLEKEKISLSMKTGVANVQLPPKQLKEKPIHKETESS